MGVSLAFSSINLRLSPRHHAYDLLSPSTRMTRIDNLLMYFLPYSGWQSMSTLWSAWGATASSSTPTTCSSPTFPR